MAGLKVLRFIEFFACFFRSKSGCILSQARFEGFQRFPLHAWVVVHPHPLFQSSAIEVNERASALFHQAIAWGFRAEFGQAGPTVVLAGYVRGTEGQAVALFWRDFLVLPGEPLDL